MKRLIITALLFAIGSGAPVLATPSIEFSPNPETAGGWTYDGAGTLSFNQTVSVDRAMSSNADPLVGASVYVPTFSVTEFSDGSYGLKPLGSSTITIRSADGTQIYLQGMLATGDLIPVGTIGAAYSSFTADITNIIITDAGKALGSAALSAIIKSGVKSLDFELSLQGGSGTNYHTLAEMLSGGYIGGNGFSGAMSIPEPATIALLSFGSLVLLRRKHKTKGNLP
jgi:hypothetical protein